MSAKIGWKSKRMIDFKRVVMIRTEHFWPRGVDE